MISVNGIHYEIAGSQPEAIVFLHYFGSSGKTWRGIMGCLSARIRCIAPDLRGFGDSQTLMEALGVEDYADDIQCLIESLGLVNYLLVGHSMGGKIAIALAARRLQGLKALILLAPSPPTPEPLSDKDRQGLRQMFRSPEKIRAHLKGLAQQPVDESVIEQETAIQMMAGGTAWQAWIDSGSRENIATAAGKINIPVLVIGGASDTGITPAILAEEVVNWLTRAEMKTLPDTGHLLHLEREADIAAIISEWMGQYSLAPEKKQEVFKE